MSATEPGGGEKEAPREGDSRLDRRWPRYRGLDLMKRGDLVVVALQGDYGKPRPALVVQSDLFDEHPSLTIAPVTSTIADAPLFRVTIEPTATNGLRAVSQIMVD